MTRLLTRRSLLLAAPAVLAGCDRLGEAPAFRDLVLSSGEWLSRRVQRLLAGDALAREYTEAEMSPEFRTNGNTRPRSQDWAAQQAGGFADWRLRVSGLVEAPRAFSLTEIKAMPARTQITRHDCVEGWSAIGKWTGVPLRPLLEQVRPAPDARYVVFRCADDFRGVPYYESIDMVSALHSQTILAYGMNGGDLPVGHGAPLRLRVERQLGYKQAKFLMGLELVSDMGAIGRGKGGFWEDAGFYEWYAGI